MITIDVLGVHKTRTERPSVQNQARLQTSGIGTLDVRLTLAQNYQRGLLQVAHNAHLLRATRAGSLAVDVQRFFEENPARVLTLAERYIFRR